MVHGLPAHFTAGVAGYCPLNHGGQNFVVRYPIFGGMDFIVYFSLYNRRKESELYTEGLKFEKKSTNALKLYITTYTKSTKTS
jgi:hypothetical protein